MFASSSSFMLLVVRRLHQNVRVIRISQLISRKCAEWVLHSALPQLLNAFSFPLQYNFSDCLVIDIVPLSLMTFWRSLRLYHHRNRLCRGMEKYNFFFIDPQKTKVNQKTYIDFLKTSLLPECRRLYPDKLTMIDFVFMQDSAPSHRAKATQNFIRDNMPDFISSQEWTPHSPDLNPLD